MCEVVKTAPLLIHVRLTIGILSSFRNTKRTKGPYIILKHLCASPPLLQKALSKSTPSFIGVFKVLDKISELSTGKPFLKTPLIISVALENSRGERAKRF